MSDLRKLAEAATPGPWKSTPVMLAGFDGTRSWSESEGRIIEGPPQTIEPETLSKRWFTRKEDAAFIAAASPDVVLGLLDDRDEARAAVRRLAGALTAIAKGIIDRKYATAGMMMSHAAEAVGDEVVWRIMEETDV